VHRVAKVEKPFMPLSAYSDSSFFKLYMADVGLLRTMAALPAEAILERIDIYKEFKGALTENYVLTELINLYNETPFFWRSANTAEVDFIIQQKLDIVPVEVKSERNTKAKSLTEYRKKYGPQKAVKTSMSNAVNVVVDDAKNGAMLTVPLYMLWRLKTLLDAVGDLDQT
jgi:predicted AAA+ superfamily ATPase